MRPVLLQVARQGDRILSRLEPSMYRIRHLIFVSAVSLIAVPARAQNSGSERGTRSNLEKVEAASLEFPAQHAQMCRYLAVVTGETDTTEDGSGNFSDFDYVFAFSQGKNSRADKKRVELQTDFQFADGTTHALNERQLKVESHYWIERGGNARDYFDKKPEERQSPVIAWDPFSMPINYWASLRVADGSSYRGVVSHIMPPGRMFDAEIDGLDRRIGRWRQGKDEELGYAEVVFDPKYGEMPTEMRIRTLKARVKTVDPKNLIKCTTLYQQNETKWFQHASGKYLPSEVRCLKFRGGTSGWKIQIEWWLDDEVPDEVFTVEDLLKAHLKASVVDQLVAERNEQKAVAERKGKQANEKK